MPSPNQAILVMAMDFDVPSRATVLSAYLETVLVLLLRFCFVFFFVAHFLNFLTTSSECKLLGH